MKLNNRFKNKVVVVGVDGTLLNLDGDLNFHNYFIDQFRFYIKLFLNDFYV